MVAKGGKVEHYYLTEAQLLLLNFQSAEALWKMKALTVDEK
jgi:hypothetical protein